MTTCPRYFRTIRSALSIGIILPWIAALAHSEYADWILIDDFQHYQEAIYSGAGSENGDLAAIYPVISKGGTGTMEIFSGLGGTWGQQSAWFSYGSVLSNAGDAFHQIPLPEEIPINGAGVVIFRILMSGYNLNWHVMLSRRGIGEPTTEENEFRNQACQLRFNPSAGLELLSARNGTTYLDSNPGYLPDLQSWYTFWIQVDNAFDEETKASTGGYKVWIMGPDDVAPWLMSWGTETPSPTLEFRNQDYAPIKTLVLLQNAQNDNGIWLIDDIYFHAGNWIGYPYDVPCACDGNWETYDAGPWLGEIYRAGLSPQDSFWGWSPKLNRPIYLPTYPVGDGRWFYWTR